MKKVLAIVLLLSNSFIAKGVDFECEITGSNQSVLITTSAVITGTLENGSLLGAFYIDNNGDYRCAGRAVWNENQAIGMALWGAYSNQDNGFEEGEEIQWYAQSPSGDIAKLEMLYGDGVNNTYQTNSFRWINKIIVINSTGCTQPNYIEYNPFAGTDDGSCLTAIAYGCTDVNSTNFDPLANTENGSCDPMAIYGCTQAQFYEYNEWATVDDGSCTTYWQALYYDGVWEIENLEEEVAAKQSQLAVLTNQNETLLLELTGLQNELNETELTLEQTSVQSAELQVQNTDLLAQNTDLLNNLNQAHTQLEEMQNNFNLGLDEPIAINIDKGWNLIGFTRRTPMDAAALFADQLDNIVLVKDNSANMFWPEFGFNGIGNLIPGQGYQMKTKVAINNFVFPYVAPNERLEMNPTVPDWVLNIEPKHPNEERKLVRKVNLLGQEVKDDSHFSGEVILLLYSDGSVEKVIY